MKFWICNSHAIWTYYLMKTWSASFTAQPLQYSTRTELSRKFYVLEIFHDIKFVGKTNPMPRTWVMCCWRYCKNICSRGYFTPRSLFMCRLWPLPHTCSSSPNFKVECILVQRTLESIVVKQIFLTRRQRARKSDVLVFTSTKMTVTVHRPVHGPNTLHCDQRPMPHNIISMILWSGFCWSFS